MDAAYEQRDAEALLSCMAEDFENWLGNHKGREVNVEAFLAGLKSQKNMEYKRSDEALVKKIVSGRSTQIWRGLCRGRFCVMEQWDSNLVVLRLGSAESWTLISAAPSGTANGAGQTPTLPVGHAPFLPA
jgi:hypothetical protein